MILSGSGSSSGGSAKTLHVVYPHTGSTSTSTLTGYSIQTTLTKYTYSILITIPNWNSNREFVGLYLPMMMRNSSNQYMGLSLTKSNDSFNGYINVSSTGILYFVQSSKVSYNQSGSNFMIGITLTVASDSTDYTATTIAIQSDHYVYLE